MNRSGLLASAVILAAAAAAGCGSGNTPASPDIQNSILISTISPANGTTLAAGSAVTFSGAVNYALNSAGAGAIVLVIEDQNNRVLNPDNQVTAFVSAGLGSVTLSERFTVPVTGVTLIQVIFSLIPTAPFSPPVATSASYPVGAAPAKAGGPR